MVLTVISEYKLIYWWWPVAGRANKRQLLKVEKVKKQMTSRMVGKVGGG